LNPAPAYKAPPAPVMQYSNWAGFYIGANGGWIRRHASEVTTVATTGAFVTSGSGSISDATAGGQAGFNYMWSSNILAGLEVDSQWTGLKDSVLATDGSNRHDSKFDYFGTFRGRLGYTANNWLFYGTGGLAWGHGEITRTQLVGTLNSATPGTVETTDKTRIGWAAGAGIEWMFARNWTGRVEYLHLDLGHETSTFPLANRAQNVTFTADVVRGGINYLFNY
jgi:outer membrane immunogenic protein